MTAARSRGRTRVPRRVTPSALAEVVLDLDHWGIGGRSSSENGWSVRLTPDIC
jgi:hypothetical protein